MSREILFRGKEFETGKWEYGYLITLPNMDSENRPLHIFDDTTQNWYKVDPSTIGQYTGLIDKNGKRIFEGDIVCGRCNAMSTYGEIVWVGGAFAINDKKRIRYTSLFRTDWVLRVDGNKWDNPELMEG